MQPGHCHIDKLPGEHRLPTALHGVSQGRPKGLLGKACKLPADGLLVQSEATAAQRPALQHAAKPLFGMHVDSCNFSFEMLFLTPLETGRPETCGCVVRFQEDGRQNIELGSQP